MIKKILVTGGSGQLGSSLYKISDHYPQYEFLFTDVDTLDITKAAAVRAFVSQNQISYILNCAAYTAVDKAEDNELSCFRLNCDAVKNLAEAAFENGAKVIHISTDYVFDGTSYVPYEEVNPTCPVSVYGRTKLAGELALFEICPSAIVIRTAWLYSEYGNNFVKTMLRLGHERDEIRVVFDQIGTPTYATDLALAMMHIIEYDQKGLWIPGIYHFSDEGVCSWYDFTVKILQLADLHPYVLPIETKDYPSKAARPHYSVLNKIKIKRTFGLLIPHWETSLRECVRILKKENQ